jgi:hypothetical protein
VGEPLNTSLIAKARLAAAYRRSAAVQPAGVLGWWDSAQDNHTDCACSGLRVQPSASTIGGQRAEDHMQAHKACSQVCWALLCTAGQPAWRHGATCTCGWWLTVRRSSFQGKWGKMCGLP